jgi:hypothetical protein
MMRDNDEPFSNLLSMISPERALATLNHKEFDRIP